MGVVDFDPETWRRANTSTAMPEVAEVAEAAKVEPNQPIHSRVSQLSQVPALPRDIRAGLARLRSMGVPVAVDRTNWRDAVAGALHLADEGWAANALALGWSPLDLFGAVTDPAGDPYSDGLAIWLERRPVLALTADYAVADNGSGGRSYFNRMARTGACLLWDLGQ